jgi:putative protease
MNKLPELLMPAGNLEKLKFAYAYGADACYAGVPAYSLRARENEFKIDTIAESIEYARKTGKKIYLTNNIIPHNRKIDGYLRALDQMVELKPDAFIMSDIGMIHLTKQRYPDIEIHLSVQANVVNWASAKYWHEAVGVSRIILSRELAISEIAEIHEKVPTLEIEAFVHGAICMAYSGRCLLSNYFNHRDANQGICTNACRWEYKTIQKVNPDFGEKQHYDLMVSDEPYQPLPNDIEYYIEQVNRPGELNLIDEDEYGTYIMNAKDLCAIEHLQEMADAGVCSFKVEGRSKSIYYVQQVARAYRMAIDALYTDKVKEAAKEGLKEVYAHSNRGFTTGFLLRNPKEYGQNYAYGESEYSTHAYLGVVRAYDKDKKMALVAPKNRFETGTLIEWIHPEWGVKSMMLNEMFDEKYNPVSVTHGGTKPVWIPCEYELNEFSMLRQPLIELPVIQD